MVVEALSTVTTSSRAYNACTVPGHWHMPMRYLCESSLCRCRFPKSTPLQSLYHFVDVAGPGAEGPTAACQPGSYLLVSPRPRKVWAFLCHVLASFVHFSFARSQIMLNSPDGTSKLPEGIRNLVPCPLCRHLSQCCTPCRFVLCFQVSYQLYLPALKNMQIPGVLSL